jgi:hypothetical protein
MPAGALTWDRGADHRLFEVRIIGIIRGADQFIAMIEADLPFKQAAARMLMTIAQHKMIIAKRHHGDCFLTAVFVT